MPSFAWRQILRYRTFVHSGSYARLVAVDLVGYPLDGPGLGCLLHRAVPFQQTKVCPARGVLHVLQQDHNDRILSSLDWCCKKKCCETC